MDYTANQNKILSTVSRMKHARGMRHRIIVHFMRFFFVKKMHTGVDVAVIWSKWSALRSGPLTLERVPPIPNK